jgi:purine-binding chemotaxis protein CheW
MDIMVAQENLKFEDIRPVPNSPQYFEGFKNLRGQIIPIINFKKLFSFSKFDMEKQKYIIIIEIEGTKFGVVVDKVLRVYITKIRYKRSLKPRCEIDNYIFGVLERHNEL